MKPNDMRCQPRVQSYGSPPFLYPAKSAEANKATKDTESMMDLAVVALPGSIHNELNAQRTKAASGMTAPRKKSSAKFASRRRLKVLPEAEAAAAADDGKMTSKNRQLWLPRIAKRGKKGRYVNGLFYVII